ncbi:sulfotransferase family protein [Rhodovulum euryhalinum]|uniref:Sulfotransferase family protein n=1 Tax=Rhodovulum euryhalinum TaxID=35805 RepID=A0A4R2L0I3_9RHOB|nr:sulfotransferase [Rhodovulum euryhalinum]TCO72515.1 sulfotransferase family protein [Rhodovulum euryhalinum]
MSNEATLLFGVGATKAGTTWLHRYLAGHPDCHLRSIKELHYFDALEEGRVTRVREELDEERARLAARPVPANRARAEARANRIGDLADWSAALADGSEAAYLDYLSNGRGTRRLVADITPAYALLPVARLKRMAAMASDVRFIYLLRDPVDRLWSHVRMIARTRANPGEAIGPRAGRILARVLAGEETHIAKRGDYCAVLTRLWAAVDPTRLCLSFYEELFSQASVDRLCAFLGIAAVPAEFSVRVHAGVPVPMSRDQRRAAAEWLAPQYDFVAERLGRVPAVWQSHRVGV